jgi:hypothetical protein
MSMAPRLSAKMTATFPLVSRRNDDGFDCDNGM